MGYWPGRAEKKTVTLDGTPLAYVESGVGDPVLLLHGFPANSFLWRDVAPRLAERYRVLVPDLPGFGHSPTPPGATSLRIPALAERLLHFLDQVKAPGCKVAGHGAGGLLAQAMAAADPRIPRLALLDTIAFDRHWPTPGVARLRVPLLGEFITTFYAATSIVRGLQGGVNVPDRIAGEVRRGYVRLLAERSDGAHGMLRFVRSLRHEDAMDAVERLRKRGPPTLVIWGEDDRYLPLSIGERYAREVPNSRLVIVPQAGHFIMEDDFEAVAGLLLEFFSPD